MGHIDIQISVHNSAERKPGGRVALSFSPLCLILHQLFNIQVNFLHRVWKQFVKKNKGVGAGKTQLDVRMDFPVCWVAPNSLSNINCSA